MYDMKYRYYIAQINEKGTVKCIIEDLRVGPYYDSTIMVSADGYDTEEEAIDAVKKYMVYLYRNNWVSAMDLVIVKQLTIRYEGDE